MNALFRAGLSYRQIAERLGISQGLAHNLKGEYDRGQMPLYQRVQHDLRNGEQSWLSGYDVLKAHARAALSTANNSGNALVGDYKMPGAGFDHDMGTLLLMDALNVMPIARGQLLVYSGDQAPVPIWSAEGAALVDNTTPTVGRVEAGPRTVSAVYEFSSALAQAGGPEAEREFMGWVDQILYEAWIGAALVGDGTMDRPRGILRNPGIHLIDYGASVDQAHIRAVRDRLRTQKGRAKTRSGYCRKPGHRPQSPEAGHRKLPPMGELCCRTTQGTGSRTSSSRTWPPWPRPLSTRCSLPTWPAELWWTWRARCSAKGLV